MSQAVGKATIVITTKNRKDELRVAVISALDQDARADVLVIDDGSTDGTSAMIRTEFPQVRLERSESSLGYIVQRNRGARFATTPYIFSIDDDAKFSSSRVVSQTLLEFEHPRIGAVAIPFANVRQDNVIRQSASDDRSIYVTSTYIGTAHALRRDLFLRLGGYREYFFHQGEEEDYCARMLAEGYLVRLGLSDPVHHFESPRRDFRRMDLFGRRNNILYAWYNVPLLFLPAHLVGTSVNGMKQGFQLGRPLRMAHGLMLGYNAIIRQVTERRPLSNSIYRLSRTLKKSGVAALHDIEDRLPRLSQLND